MRMTLEDVVQELRRHGISMSKKTLADGTSQRVFPFGQEIRTGKTGRRTFIIMKADFEKWLEEKA